MTPGEQIAEARQSVCSASRYRATQWAGQRCGDGCHVTSADAKETYGGLPAENRRRKHVSRTKSHEIGVTVDAGNNLASKIEVLLSAGLHCRVNVDSRE